MVRACNTFKLNFVSLSLAALACCLGPSWREVLVCILERRQACVCGVAWLVLCVSLWLVFARPDGRAHLRLERLSALPKILTDLRRGGAGTGLHFPQPGRSSYYAM